MNHRNEFFYIPQSAIVIHGLVHRSLQHTVDSLRCCVIAPLERHGPVDVFFHSWEVAEVNNPRGGEQGKVLDAAELVRWLPEAQGLFESQEEFDGTVEWERLFRNNPMRQCCKSDDEARATLMNLRRALESQERAWRVFEARKTKRYDLVVATRADLRFLGQLGVGTLVSRQNLGGQERPPSLWVPMFHPWGGVNDRFAIGNEEGVRIWSQRVAFAEEWLEKAKGESAEWLLMKWLEKKRVRVGFLDFTFQRVRANGRVAERDRDLKGKECEGKNAEISTSPLIRERFLILAREAGAQAESLRRVLEPLGRVEVVVDRAEGEPEGQSPPVRDMALLKRPSVWVPDEEAAGFGGLMGRTADFPRITAWSRALAHLAATMKEDEAVWFVEDDVAGDAESFSHLVELTRARNPDLAARDIRTQLEDADWYFWPRAEGRFEEPVRAFQPLCRVSARLLREVFRFGKSHGGFVFHEILFASLAKRDAMELLEWESDPQCSACFSTFVYRPEVTSVMRGIAHPVKDGASHEAICANPPAAFPRMGLAKRNGWAILADDYLFLVKFCRDHAIRKVAEFGPGDSTLALLDAGCEVVSYEHDIGRLKHSVERFAHEGEVEVVHCPEGTLPDPLPHQPDLVFVDGPPYREGLAMSRIGPCEWALETCGCFLLHDANRHGELATLEEMERRGMHVFRIPTRKGMALVADSKRRPEIIQTILNQGRCPVDISNVEAGYVRDEWLVLLSFTQDNRIPGKILQCGAADGLRTRLLLESGWNHPDSVVHAIECFDGDVGSRMRESFEANVVNHGLENRVQLYDGEAREILAWMIAGEGFWESFNFIDLAAKGDPADLLADACQAWSLLKSGGMMLIAADEKARGGMAAFREVYKAKSHVMAHEIGRVLLQKA